VTRNITFILLSYNNATTILEALDCAFRQTHHSLDIVVSDDCSTDGSFALIKRRIARDRGPHNVRAVRNSSNLGIVGNINAAVAHAQGDLLVIAAGDDRSHPERVTLLVERWEAAGSPTACVLYSDVTPIDSAGRPVEGWSERVARPPWTLERLAEGKTGPLGAGCAITRRLLTEPTPISPSVVHEDRVFAFRARLLGGEVLFIDHELVQYRIHGGISRLASANKMTELTTAAKTRLGRVIADARQRLADARSARAPKRIIERCRQVVAEQEAMLAMASGKQILTHALEAVRGDARASRMAMHLLRFARARFFQ